MKTRIILFTCLVIVWSGALGARLYELQIRRHEEFSRRAASQQQRVVEVSAPRGTVYDARGRDLAVSVEVESVYAVPRELADPTAAAGTLSSLLDLELQPLADRLRSDREFVWVARKLDPDLAGKVRALDLDGVYFLLESRRYYPMRSLAAQVLGYVGMDDEGLAGLEARYEEIVRGGAVSRVLLRDALRASVALPEFPYAEAQPGSDLHLTLDASLQYIAEKELARSIEENRAAAGVVVMLDPRDSAVLALVSHPTYDPNRFADYAEDAWKNRAIGDVFEPGSTFKMVTAASAFESLLVSPEDFFFCENGSIVLGRTRIRDHKPFGLLSFREVIVKSSNVGVIKAAHVVGDERLHSMIRAFGFGQRSGLDLPGESPGIVHPVEQWRAISKAYISFGQGISVTAIQLANAFAAVANGGRLSRPYLVRAVGREDEISPLPRKPPLGRPVSPQTALTLERVLEAVVSSGTGRRAQVEGYRVAGKTGTAEKVIPGVGYSPTGRLASFVGFVPAREPRIVCLVMLDEPKVRTHGGQVAAPVFSAIARQALLYLGIAPDADLWPPRDGAGSEPRRLVAESVAEGGVEESDGRSAGAAL